VLTAEELNELRACLDEAMNMPLRYATDHARGEYAKIFRQRVNLWRDHEGIRRYVFSPKIAEIARRLARVSGVRLWHDHALVKMPQDSRATAWHQDLPYWPMNEEGALSCWMAVDDVDEKNGCMVFLPGSHKFGRLPPINLVEPQDIFAYLPKTEAKMPQPAVCPLRAGSCTFHNGLTFHYAFPNTTDRPRRAMITIYMPDGTTYRKQGHLVTDPLNLAEGVPLTGELFPLLAPA